jgi:fatty acid desaturase
MSGKRQARKKIEQGRGAKTPVFTTKNYQILGIAIALLAIGFGGMYLENEFTGWFSLYISPLLIVGGFITVVFAILHHTEVQQINE